MPHTRQLTAIMFTDIQGYTATMQRDEELAIKIRERHREVFNSTTEKFNGRILQYFGDGTLSTFASVIEAVNCAMEMQLAFQREPVIPVRIGIHLGDIVLKDDEIIGDGVNVASRIESLAVAGSVFISDKVYDEIKNQSSIEARSLKTFELKNVDKPIEVFAISNKGLIVPNVEDISGKTKKAENNTYSESKKGLKDQPKSRLNLILWAIIGLLLIIVGYYVLNGVFLDDPGKSIAVLPFVNMTNDPAQEYFSDGITEDILTHLSKVADLKVVSRTSTLQYKNTTKTIPQIGKELGVSTVLEGSVRKSGNKVRITAQLINAKTDVHIWAETYDRDVSKIFDIQTEVAKEILIALKTNLTPREEKSLDKSVTSEITAYDYYLRGTETFHNGETKQDMEQAAGFFIEAINIDSGFAAAYVGLAKTMIERRFYGSDINQLTDSALILNQKALSLDPELDEAHYLQSLYYLMIGDRKKAVAGFEKVLQINPNHEKAMINLGSLLMEGDQLEKGLGLVVDGMMLELNSKDPDFYIKLGEAYVQIGELENAIKYLNQAIKLKPDCNEAYSWLREIGLQTEDYAAVLIHSQKIVEIEENVFSLDRLGWAYMLGKDYINAAETWNRVGELLNEYDDSYYAVAYKHRLAYVLWQMGKVDEAREMLNDVIDENLFMINNEIKKDIKGQAYDLAACYAFLGNEDKAMQWAYRAEEEGFFPIDLVNRDPMFNAFRDHEKFEQLLLKKRKEEERVKPRLDLIRKKLHDLENMGVLSLN